MTASFSRQALTLPCKNFNYSSKCRVKNCVLVIQETCSRKVLLFGTWMAHLEPFEKINRQRKKPWRAEIVARDAGILNPIRCCKRNLLWNWKHFFFRPIIWDQKRKSFRVVFLQKLINKVQKKTCKCKIQHILTSILSRHFKTRKSIFLTRQVFNF